MPAERNLIQQLFWASRPVSWINTAYPFGFAYWLVTGQLDATFWIGTLFFLIPYNLLMYGINDVFDYESDLRNPRKGSIEGAVLAKKWHRPTLIWAFGLPVPFVVYLLAVGTLASAFWLLVILFTVIAYSAAGLRFKEKPVLDSVTSASHFVGPMLVGVTIASGNPPEPTFVFATVAFMLWGMASHAFGSVQDIRADRDAGIASIGTKLGAAATVWFALGCYLLAGALLLLCAWPIPLVALACLPYLFVVGPYLRLRDDDCERANRGWRRFMWLNFFAGAVVTLVVL